MRFIDGYSGLEVDEGLGRVRFILLEAGDALDVVTGGLTLSYADAGKLGRYLVAIEAKHREQGVAG